jgi:hypothetical protein
VSLRLQANLIEEFGQEWDQGELKEFAANLAPAVQWMREAGYVESEEDLLLGTKRL